jgi:hypothetical protein
VVRYFWLGVGDLLLKIRRSVRPYQAGFLRIDLTVIFTCCVSLALVLAARPPGVLDQATATQFAAIPAAEHIVPTSRIVSAPRILLAGNTSNLPPYLLLP